MTFKEAQQQMDFEARRLEEAAAKLRNGDVRGARTRMEFALHEVQVLERECCNENGKLCDPGEGRRG